MVTVNPQVVLADRIAQVAASGAPQQVAELDALANASYALADSKNVPDPFFNVQPVIAALVERANGSPVREGAELRAAVASLIVKREGGGR